MCSNEDPAYPKKRKKGKDGGGGTIIIGVGTTAMGLCSGEDKLDSTLNITRKVRIYSQTAGWGSQ